ncbi:MAG TPA: hypothetical protein VI488_09910 [Candidatus Angelobacter sp.]
MSSQVQIAQTVAEQIQEQVQVTASPGLVAHWSLALRITFRFCFAYFTLFCLSNQILGGLLLVPKVDIPDLGVVWPLRQITFWTAAHVFRVTRTLVYNGSGSGDKTFDWVQAFCLLCFAAMITAVWSILDRHRKNYVALYKWFRLFMRFALASEMLLYALPSSFLYRCRSHL